jgi:hypothetical protein
MKRRAILVTTTVLGFAFGMRLDAQTCLGRSSFASGALRAGVSYRDNANSNVFGGELAYGTPRALFAGAELSTARPQTSPADFSSSSTRIGGTVGAQVVVSDAARVQFCPTLGIGVAFGSSDSPTRHTESRTPNIDLGVALGMSTGATDELHFIPSVGFKYAIERTSGTTTNAGSAPVDFHTTMATGTGYAMLGLGIARGAVTVTPIALLPIADGQRSKQWGIAATYNFGRRR